MSHLKERIESYIERNREKAMPVLNDIMSTANLTQDYIWNVKQGNENHFINDNGKLIAIIGDVPPMRLHQNSLGQIAERLNVPSAYLKRLADNSEWGVSLAKTILNEHLANSDRQRLLVREVRGEIRGILSDSYRRLNSLPLFDAFVNEAMLNGAKFIGARFDGLKAVMEVVNPNIISFKLPDGKEEHLCFGAIAQNSDFGVGSYQVQLFILKAVCINGMIGRSFINQRHLGSRIPDDVIVSENTMKKDTEFFRSLTKDTIATVFSDKYKEEYIARVTSSAKVEIDLKEEIERLPKVANFTKGECDTLESLILASKASDGLDLPPTKWKLINGITALARDVYDEKPMRSLELQEYAGKVLDNIKLN